jgi:hypothetical protein
MVLTLIARVLTMISSLVQPRDCLHRICELPGNGGQEEIYFWRKRGDAPAVKARGIVNAGGSWCEVK